MKPLRWLLWVAMPIAVMADVPKDERWVVVNFREAPLPQIADFYRDVSGRRVEIEPGEYPVISISFTDRKTAADTLALIEAWWVAHGIRVHKTNDTVYLAPQPELMPADVPRLRINAPSANTDSPATNRLERRLIKKPWAISE